MFIKPIENKHFIRLWRVWIYLTILVIISMIYIIGFYEKTYNWVATDVEEVVDTEMAIIDAEVSKMPKPWFMKKGHIRPERAEVEPTTGRRTALLWPEEDEGDRLIEQLMFVPPDYPELEERNSTKLKKILIYHAIEWSQLQDGREAFLSAKCPVDTCEVTNDHLQADSADAIFFRDQFGGKKEPKRPSWEQVWIFFVLESPYHTHSFPSKNAFNWTATYRHDSDIVYPYNKFVPYNRTGDVRKAPLRNYAAKKTKKVAWFVSNCYSHNDRINYAKELSKYIEVDIFGLCGSLKCARDENCLEMLDRDYKFYLSFENSNCKDYITEKFFTNALGHNVIPVVMGARKEDYERAAPPHSYIYLEDFASPKELADYLHLLDRNDTLYNEYFLWKGTGEFVSHYFWCRVCAMLHDNHPPKVYENLNDWWSGSGTCVNRRWNGKPWW